MVRIAVPASESSSEPGRTRTETTIEAKRVVPEKSVVRPAVRRVEAAAAAGLAPLASSSRNRDTISSA